MVSPYSKWEFVNEEAHHYTYDALQHYKEVFHLDMKRMFIDLAGASLERVRRAL